VVEILIMNTVEVDGHGVAALTKRLDATGGAELVVDDVLVEVVGSHRFFTSYLHLALRDEGEKHPFSLTVTTIALHSFGKIGLYLQGHRTAVTAAMICFHRQYYTRFDLGLSLYPGGS
jgi:hypothetical protein